MIDINKTTQRITGITTFVGITVFCLFLFMPTVDTVLNIDKSEPINEQRAYSEVPGMPQSWKDIAQFPLFFENAFNDRFGFRKSLLRLNNYLHVVLLSTSPVAKVMLGKDGWLYYIENALDNYRHLPGRSSVQEWRDILNKRQLWLEKNGIEFLVALAPDKHSIYPEYIPEKYNKVKEKSFHDELIEELRKSTNVKILDLRPSLIEGKKRERVYDKTGTHWNQFGAYIATNDILNHLSKTFPAIESALPLESPFDDDGRVERDGSGLAEMMGLEKSSLYPEIPRVRIDHRPNHVTLKSHLPCYSYGKQNILTVSNNKSLPKGVIFRDSFSSMLLNYLSEGFSELTYFWQDRIDRDAILELKPDIVIEEFAERKLMLGVDHISDLQSRVLKLKDAEVKSGSEYAVKIAEFEIKKEKRKGILAVPPCSLIYSGIKIPYNVKLSFGIGLAQRAWMHDGDGVEFLIKIRRVGEKRFRIVFSTHLDPYHCREDRKWCDFKVDLSEYVGLRVDMVLETRPGLNKECDFAFWSRISF